MPVLVDLEDERLGELGPDVERGAGGRSPSRCQIRRRRPSDSVWRPRGGDRVEGAGRPSRRCPCPGPSGRPPPLPSIGRRARTRSPRDPPRTASSAVTNSWARRIEPEGDDVGLERARRSLAAPSSHRSIRTDRRTEQGDPAAGRDDPFAQLGRPGPAAAPALSRRFASRSSSWSAAIRSGPASIVFAPTISAASSRSSRRCARNASAASPVSASIRRTPVPMLRSATITNPPTWPDARQWVPPHSSWLYPSTRTVRTVSPYFSSKNASAPAAIASAIVIRRG